MKTQQWNLTLILPLSFGQSEQSENKSQLFHVLSANRTANFYYIAVICVAKKTHHNQILHLLQSRLHWLRDYGKKQKFLDSGFFLFLFISLALYL